MRKISLLLMPMLLLFLAVGFQSCDKDEITEYIADDNTFANFADWSLDVTKNGIDPSLGAAHGGNNENTVRKIYFQDGVSRDGDEYPIGARIIKHSFNPDGLDMLTGMVKRGNDFDSEHNDWEYFVLMPDGKIATDADGNKMRGSANLMNGGCIGCHSNFASKDYIASK
jgi:hypothetical protein